MMNRTPEQLALAPLPPLFAEKTPSRFVALACALSLLTLAGCAHSATQSKNAPTSGSSSSPSSTTASPLTSSTQTQATPPRFMVTSKNDEAFASTQNPSVGASTPSATKLQLLWVSLDGMKREDVEKYASKLKNPHPKGFRFLLGKGRTWTPVRVTNPSITSSSHVSTITCAPPGVHGILDNGQWNGEKMESGFNKPYATENFVAALRKEGKRVGVLGYPGFDSKTENRTADFAVAYDNPSMKAQFYALEGSTPVRFELESRVKVGAKYAAIAQWNTATNKATLDFGVSGRHDVGTEGWTDVVFEEAGIAQLVSLRVFLKPATATASATPVLYVSATMQNNASPESFRKEMDAQKLIFSPGKSYRVRSDFGDEAFLRTMEHRLAFFEQAGVKMLAKNDADAFFLYLEDLDVLGHQYAGDAKSDTLRASHFAKVDQTLGRLLSLVPDSTNVLIVGDHGMSAVQYELSAVALIPNAARGKFVVRASGGSLFLYGTEKNSLLTPAPTGEQWFEDTVKALNAWRLPSDKKKPLFPKVVVKGSPKAAKEGWKSTTPLPWIAAFATPGVGIRETIETGLLVSVRRGSVLPPDLLAQAAGGDASKLGEPVPYGQHGHDADSADMKTSVVTFGPRFSALARQWGQQTTNLALVPFAADALGWPRPESCAQAKP